MLRTPDDRKAHLEALYWQASEEAWRSHRNITHNDMPPGLDADEREAWWAGTCGGNEARRQA